MISGKTARDTGRRRRAEDRGIEFSLSRDGQPIYLQICARFKAAIAQGHLRPGDRVPSVRSLASELGLSRGTATLAYQLLAEEGYFEFRGAAGTFVDFRHAQRAEKRSKNPAPPAEDRSGSPSNDLRPLRLGLPALDAFPRKTWNRLVGRHSRRMDAGDLAYPDSSGHGPLRERIAAYLGVSRGIVCSPDQVFITSGHRATLNLILRTLSRPDDIFWFEEPGYLIVREFLLSNGARLQPVAVDRDGLDVAAGVESAPHAKFAIVTPANQSPLGVMMSLERRQQLLRWAGAGERWIIEDDYDSEYRYNRRPPASLKSLDADERVLYTGSFSKVLYPGLRLSYLVVPSHEMGRFSQSSRLIDAGGPILHQAVIADFMQQGHFARHLKKMRGLYAQRRQMFADALHHVFGDRLDIISPAAGLHIVARPIGYSASDVAIAAQAQKMDLGLQALSPWHMGADPASGLLLGFTNVADAGEALKLASMMRDACGAAST
ncbi:MAG: PLP-dependent aminotransferase family protein [Rhizobiaceae bacterium]|nr:PLP-dependent aminotransferase family protein [Rhizobiaceae bacterium]